MRLDVEFTTVRELRWSRWRAPHRLVLGWVAGRRRGVVAQAGARIASFGARAVVIRNGAGAAYDEPSNCNEPQY